MLIQKKSIIIGSVTEILHINVIQCQLILIKHLSSFLRMTILIYSIFHVAYDYKWKLLNFHLFSFIY